MSLPSFSCQDIGQYAHCNHLFSSRHVISSTINEVIKTVLNSLFFLQNYLTSTKKHKTAYSKQKQKNAYKKQSKRKKVTYSLICVLCFCVVVFCAFACFYAFSAFSAFNGFSACKIFLLKNKEFKRSQETSFCVINTI